ncbi:hypothetical protein DFH08DRAFT_1079048 [Mycena albidolilacea]|uniref:Uncharacterized protein n=1 Tax=Mycena albidolilacea TaxID=1033008 RepID=A0AAD7ESH1_9AGAR|nr:hypothetical protein DFH08DRAFT_1079048 [Mycena albidolilacea]
MTGPLWDVIRVCSRDYIPAFDSSFLRNVSCWTVVDQAIQKDFFVTILTYTKSLELHSHSDWPAIEARLWACDLFWFRPFPGNPIPVLDGIEPACLRLLREALKLYHEAADAGLEREDEVRVPMDTTSSKRLLAAVEKDLSDYASTSDASSNINTGEMQHLRGKEGSLKLEGKAEDVDEE